MLDKFFLKYDWGDQLINSATFPEVKVLAENHCVGWQIGYFPKNKGLLI